MRYLTFQKKKEKKKNIQTQLAQQYNNNQKTIWDEISKYFH